MKPTVSGMRKIKSTGTTNFWNFFLARHSCTILVEKSAFNHKMFSKMRIKSAFSSDETVKSAQLRCRNLDQQRARAFKKDVPKTYPVLNHFWKSLIR